MKKKEAKIAFFFSRRRRLLVLILLTLKVLDQKNNSHYQILISNIKENLINSIHIKRSLVDRRRGVHAINLGTYCSFKRTVVLYST